MTTKKKAVKEAPAVVKVNPIEKVKKLIIQAQERISARRAQKEKESE